MEEIVLASGSAFRRECFRLLGLPFRIVPAMIDESLPPCIEPKKAAGDLAVKKVQSVLEKTRKNPPPWIFGADTIIFMENEIFGKPQDKNEAALMLNRLSGRSHQAVTAIALYNGRQNRIDLRQALCKVRFAELSQGEIDWYLDTEEWRDAAAGYRMQGLGSCLIFSVNGSHGAVSGLPMREFCDMLKSNGYPFGSRISAVGL